MFILYAALAATLASGQVAQQELLINAAGATFPYPIYCKWFEAFHSKYPKTQINYQAIGSEGGIHQITADTVDFGATDGPLNETQMKAFQNKRGSAILHFPTVLGAVVPTYNIPGVSGSLNFTADALAGIFLGKITNWNHPELTRVNPGVKLPANRIIVVHRSDSSGTTYVWTGYLSKINKEWGMKAGRSTAVNWPTGLGAKGNEGVSGSIQATPNSIGYVELTYAVQKKLTYGKVKNSAGEFIRADLASVTAAGESAAMPDDFRVSITNAPGRRAYPISSFTWLLIPSKIADPAKKKAIKAFAKWMLADGQKMTEALSYVPLPNIVVTKELKALDRIQ